jgi:ATP phosphoribosyltransferase
MQSTEIARMTATTSGLAITDIRLGLPKGRMQENLLRLFQDAGIPVGLEPRGYRATVPLEGFQAKLLKPQNIVEMLHAGSRDAGFAGADWVAELDVDLVELLDTGLDPVRVVAAAPSGLLVDGALPADRSFVVASEYAGMTAEWIASRGIDAQFVRSYGATEVFPPEDADCIIDNVATGSTLRANGLEIVDELMQSSTRLYANNRVLDDPQRRDRLEDLVLLLRSVVVARERVMLEVNVAADRLDSLVGILPCMREPTVSTLHGNTGFAVKAAVPRRALPSLVLEIKSAGGTDIVVGDLSQIVP